MQEFVFKAVDAEGQQSSGQITARDEREVLDSLSAQGLSAYAVTPAGAHQIRWWQREVHLGGDGIPRREIAQFFSSLSLLLEAKIPIEIALELTTAESRNARLRQVGDQARRAVIGGGTLVEVLAEAPDVIPARYTALIGLGERANALASIAREAAELAGREAASQTAMRDALVYPIILLAVSVVIILGLIFFLAPTLAPVFASLGAEPPRAISAMLAIGQFLEAWGFVTALGLLVFLGGLAWLRQRGALAVDLRSHVPVLSDVLREAEQARAIRSLHLLLASGVPIPEALRATASDVPGGALKRFFVAAEEHVVGGGRLSGLVMTEAHLPDSVKRLFRLGDETDRLAELVGVAAKALEERSARRMNTLIRALTPALTILIALIVGGIIFTTMTAILDANDLVLQ